MNIFIVGSGKLANAILTSDLLASYNLLKWNIGCRNLGEKVIVIHAGSGRQLKECIKFCSITKSVFIELSTGLKSEDIEPDFPLIICANTSMLVLKTLKMLEENVFFKNYEISIIESHQSSKTTKAGTAIAFANALGCSSRKIKSIRNPDIQENEINIPQKYLKEHAYHRIVIKDKNEEISIETKVLGHKSYAKGVKKIIEIVQSSDLENRRYSILEII